MEHGIYNAAPCSTGMITLDTLIQGFVECELQAQRRSESFLELSRRIQPYRDAPATVFLAASRLVASGLFPWEMSLHPREAERLQEIVRKYEEEQKSHDNH